MHWHIWSIFKFHCVYEDYKQISHIPRLTLRYIIITVATDSVDKLLKSPLFGVCLHFLVISREQTHSDSLVEGNIWDLREPELIITQCQTLKTDDMSRSLCSQIHSHWRAHVHKQPNPTHELHNTFIFLTTSTQHWLSVYGTGRESCAMVHFEVCFIKAPSSSSALIIL